MNVTPLEIYKASREELTPIGRAIQRLTKHPYGNLSQRWREWLERDTRALKRYQEQAE